MHAARLPEPQIDKGREIDGGPEVARTTSGDLHSSTGL